MSKEKFLAKMTIAYMQKLGVAPTQRRLTIWARVWKKIIDMDSAE